MIAREVYVEAGYFRYNKATKRRVRRNKNPLRLRRNRFPAARQLLVVVNVAPQTAAD